MATMEWEFTRDEICAVQRIVDDQRQSPFVQSRREENVEPASVDVSESEFWDALLAALLTSRQRSGPESQVFTFIQNELEKVGIDRCRATNELQSYLSKTLEGHGGIRYYNNIAEYSEKNLRKLDSEGGWQQLEDELADLQHAREREPKSRDYAAERRVSEFLHSGLAGEGLHGIGPKQSRNVLQVLGLTRYETPLDSRITSWVNENLDLPYHVTGDGLSHQEYYQFVMDIVQDTCAKADVLPCIFDSAVFSSYDSEWSEEAAATTF